MPVRAPTDPLPKKLCLSFQLAAPDLDRIRDSIIACELCPRLRDYCTRIGETRRRAYQDQTTGRAPFPASATLAPASSSSASPPAPTAPTEPAAPSPATAPATSCIPVLHELGLATKPRAISRDDGLRLRHAWIASVVRCAPPGDKPTPQEIRNCAAHLAAEIGALPRVRVVVCLGKIAWDGYPRPLLAAGVIARRSDYRFSHAAEYLLPNGLHLLGSYHPSLRNTNTGRLNRAMFARVFVRARELAGLAVLSTPSDCQAHISGQQFKSRNPSRFTSAQVSLRHLRFLIAWAMPQMVLPRNPCTR